MTALTSVFVLLCLLLLALSAVKYGRSHLSPGLKITFIVIRLILVAVLLLCFFEPTLKYSRLAPQKRSIAVLIDNSLSMSLFQPDSSIIPIIDRLKAVSSADNTKTVFSFFLFGDSLRTFKPEDKYKPSDTHSFFPDISAGKISSADYIFILSDANWQINGSLSDKLSARSAYYFALPSPVHESSLSVKVTDGSADSINLHDAINLSVEGFSKNKSVISVNIYEQGNLIKNVSFKPSSETVDTLLSLAMPQVSPGRHLYRIVSLLSDHSVRSETFHLKTVEPEHFNYHIVNSVPSSDMRFFSLAMQNRHEFRKSEHISEKTDLLVFFSYSDETQKTVSALSPACAVAFIGCKQSCDSVISVPSDFRLSFSHEGLLTPLGSLISGEVPPPAGIIACPVRLDAERPLILSNANRMHDSAGKKIVSVGTYRNHAAISLNVNGFWRWDFWPHSHERGEEQPFFFSSLFVSTIKEMIINNISGIFVAYPYKTNSGGDSALFAISVPKGITISSKASVSFTFTNAIHNEKHYSSRSYNLNGAPFQTIRTTPLDTGLYVYTCRLVADGKISSYTDTLYVCKDNSERLVRQQNASLIGEFAQRLPANTDSIVSAFIDRLPVNRQSGNEEHIYINRSWLLLGILFVFFIAEWILRRRFGLD